MGLLNNKSSDEITSIASAIGITLGTLFIVVFVVAFVLFVTAGAFTIGWNASYAWLSEVIGYPLPRADIKAFCGIALIFHTIVFIFIRGGSK